VKQLQGRLGDKFVPAPHEKPVSPLAALGVPQGKPQGK